MLTVNADEYPVMKHFHRTEDEKRTPIVLVGNLMNEWLNADETKATEMMSWSQTPSLVIYPSPRQ